MIRELKTLITIAREGTFVAAGARLGLTQAAVSAQMRRLEVQLGAPLFERTGRSARLNALGQQTLVRAQELIRLYDDLGGSPARQPAGSLLTLGAIASVQRSRLPDALARFHKLRPDCRIRVLPGVSLQLADLVDAGEIDMAAIIRPPLRLQGDLDWTSLGLEPFKLLVPRPITSGDWAGLLSSQPFIRYDRNSFGGRQVTRFLRHLQLAPKEVCEIDELEAITRLVANGVGIALVPQTAGHQRWPATVRAISLGRQTFYRELGLLHRHSSALSEPVRCIIEMLRSTYRVTGIAAHR